MSFDPTHTFVRNPREAATAFSKTPKQRNAFIVRFLMNGDQTGADQDTLTNLTFVAKVVDRPKINIKTEEMHQYNKKRQIYTGFKIEPVRMQFYDTGGSALMMWQAYAKYYFGDFNDRVESFYNYDVTTEQFLGQNNGFGFTGANNGATDANGQFYFKKIQIYHFYDNFYDLYELNNPRITQFEPDDLDYENNAVSLISMTVAYEDLQYSLQQKSSASEAMPEFAKDAKFNGDSLITPNPLTPDASWKSDAKLNRNSADASDAYIRSIIQAQQALAANYRYYFDDESLMDVSANASDAYIRAIAQAKQMAAANYRYYGGASAGGLSVFGNFAFGPLHISGGLSLGAMASGNVGLAASLNLGIRANIGGGITGATFDVAMGRSTAVTSGYGYAATTLSNGILASTALYGDRGIGTSAGVRLMPAAYGAINVQQSGTAQYGYNAPNAPYDPRSDAQWAADQENVPTDSSTDDQG